MFPQLVGTLAQTAGHVLGAVGDGLGQTGSTTVGVPQSAGYPNSMMDQMKEVMFAEGDVDLVHPQELKRASIKLLEEIGQGEFGAVKKALFRPDAGGTSMSRRSNTSLSIEFIVAVKMLKGDPTSAEKGEFFREAAVTAQFHHDNGEGHCCS